VIFGFGTARLTLSVTRLLPDHAAAVRHFATRAADISPDRWNVERAPGKWTPAQEANHLALGYEAFVRDLRGGPTLRLRGRWWQRRLWRWRVLPQILDSGRIPHGARAPREARPSEHPGDQSRLLAELGAQAAQFEAVVMEMQSSQPRRRVNHPYFGALTLPQLVRFCTVHTRHHTAFLPSAAVNSRDGG
jgi:DinB superfamily